MRTTIEGDGCVMCEERFKNCGGCSLIQDREAILCDDCGTEIEDESYAYEVDWGEVCLDCYLKRHDDKFTVDKVLEYGDEHKEDGMNGFLKYFFTDEEIDQILKNEVYKYAAESGDKAIKEYIYNYFAYEFDDDWREIEYV